MSADAKPNNEPELPRDVLAAIAMHGLLSSGPVPGEQYELMGVTAYFIADNMLAARSKP